MALTFIRFLNILLVAVLAGTSFGIWLGFNPAEFSFTAYIEQQQNLVKSLNMLMILLVVLATITTVVSAFLQRSNRTVFVTLLIAAAFLVSCIIITRLGNVPVQNEMLQWSAIAVPQNWVVLRDQWWSFHVMRTAVELIALILVAWTLTYGKVRKTTS